MVIESLETKMKKCKHAIESYPIERIQICKEKNCPYDNMILGKDYGGTVEGDKYICRLDNYSEKVDKK